MELFKCPRTGLPAVETCGDVRLYAAFPSRPEFMKAAPKFADKFQLIPRSEWKPFSNRPWAGKTLDQNGQGACVGHGECKAFTIAHRKSGATPVDFSPCFAYGLINGGRDQGAVLSDAIEALAKTGICLESEVGPKNIYQRNWPKSAFETAAEFKAVEYFRVGTMDEIVTAAMLGFGVFVGGEIGGNFANVDSKYRVPRRLAGGGGGHCRAVTGLAIIDTTWMPEELNSWGQQFGNAGVCYVWEDYYSEGDNWAIRVATDDPADEPPAVVV
jgi:hypothetical protein